MKYRQIRKIDTGQWINVLFTVDGPAFSVPPASHQADIALGLGLASTALEVRDADSDVRVGTLLAVPAPPPPPADPDLAAFDAGTVAEKLAILRRRVLVEP